MHRTTQAFRIGLGLLLCGSLPIWAADTFKQMPPVQQLSLVLLILLAAVCIKVGLLALLLLVSVLRPGLLRNGGEIVRLRPVRCLVAGALGLLVFLAFTALLQHAPARMRALLGIAELLVFLALLITGLCVTVYELGDRLQSNLNARGIGSTSMAVLYGGGLFVLLGFLPGLGQLVEFTVAVLSLGAAILLLAAGKARSTPVPPATPETCGQSRQA